MKTKRITQLGETVLRTTGRKLSKEEILSPSMQQLMDVMIATMHKEDGIGLAAQQIGESLMLAIVSHMDGDLVVCNPKIIKRSFRKVESEEGCLSIRGVFGLVKRHKTITVEYVDRMGNPQRMHAEGLLARVFQHETDHLNGIVYADRTKKITTGTVPKE
ncbi:MAG: peptide deformylase [Patescibacteria group bacterium]|jgi:peptide deformylase